MLSIRCKNIRTVICNIHLHALKAIYSMRAMYASLGRKDLWRCHFSASQTWPQKETFISFKADALCMSRCVLIDHEFQFTLVGIPSIG